ncbi:GerMN domain-containing protein [Streptomyces sp. NPDC001262]|uniref:GerMN domain-containing protein n=1 Tax=Streptomyces sp. NPDC001262 TaxID=3364552 RepID=UPI0036B51FB3
MTMRRAMAVSAVSAALLGTLAGCGIEPTDVVEVGLPATGVKRPGARVEDAVLYFASQPGGVPLPLHRPAGGEVTAEEAVQLLLKGPNDAERMRGLYTELPRDVRAVEIGTGQGEVKIRLSTDLVRLTPLARMQVVCTAVHNAVPGDLPAEDVKVDLSGTSGKPMPDQTCQVKDTFTPPMSTPTP